MNKISKTSSKSSMIMVTAISNTPGIVSIKHKGKPINTYQVKEWYFNWKFPFIHRRYIILGFIKGKSKQWGIQSFN